MTKEIYTHIILKNGISVRSLTNFKARGDGDAIAEAKRFEDQGADGILIIDLSESDAEHDRHIDLMREIGRSVRIPMIAGGAIHRVEDVKKLLYAGCSQALLDMSVSENAAMLKEVSDRFGKDKIACVITDQAQLEEYDQQIQTYASLLLLVGEHHLYEVVQNLKMPALTVLTRFDHQKIQALLQAEQVAGITGSCVLSSGSSIYNLKQQLAESGIAMKGSECSLKWEDLKLNSDGLLPVVVQEHSTGEVLMVAYMNEEAFLRTIRTGKMHYFSRSRQSLWLKGETSGHYQQMISLHIDCDNDTLLAKIVQTGAACHTGNHSCFYRSILNSGSGDRKNPLTVFDDVYGVIMDRKEHPKEGSYTNYLFDKGIDKILKKLGEEATEIVIAAKNPNPEEIKYEAADFLYHLMVLMAERGVTWDDITEELSKR
ncbi:MAG: bifunctional phosphoribosyl-AMP cyclohydrolase/phosphoribosyl-ATP diphosphatase HisIE [Lachnospiraceae bacterium]|nr:bifunctional phosphoribosyl-AMP cyclohydrolase/phosphoribosyl-ATP diphosphatase HisIE [Lachnospiraceae bacterium]